MWNVFLTGATGFLGGELAVALSKLDSVDKIRCLVRASSDDVATARLERVFGLHEDRYDRRKVEAVRGDLADQSLTLNLAGDARLSDTNLVIHAGANTSFLTQKYPAIWETNVNGTRRVAEWAAQLPSLHTFAYVGTATIVGAGPEAVGRRILEDESPNPDATHLVGYTRTKAIAEMTVRATIPPSRLTVIRPSILLGDTRPVVPRSFDIGWIIVAMRHLRMFFANPDATCDIIPVDYAARAIVNLLMSQRHHSTYHVSAGDAATTCRELGKALCYNDCDLPNLLFCPREHLEPVKRWLRTGDNPSPEIARYSRHLEHIRLGIGRKQARMLLAGLEPYWAFIDMDQSFDNSRLLADTGIGLPEPAHQYLKRTAAYFEQVDPLLAAVNP